ncbi:hypothetical protein HHL16_08405 [Pseudoflavitalea sp. G-6-1-2]|uniref:ATP-binding protein n=1 Tax=Pseudoflavitalea sp. G-6-1-2 TaxID=2728841 RepID=UPI00146C20C2|nr:ATP-binding protein [Pseudoflavitalea sp. G-6-1-2]NML20892.1 hypothetical protein [Pseudoflavitalea sp. G-6-1-2]
MKPVTTSIFPILLLFLLFSVRIDVSAQQPSSRDAYLLVDMLNDNSGLPQNSIISQYIDTSSGMLWLATFGGLARYNGIAVKSFDHQLNESLLTNRMVNLFKTTGGDVYAMNVHSQLLQIRQQDIAVNQAYTWIWQQYGIFVWFKGILHSLDEIPKMGTLNFNRPSYYPEQSQWAVGDYNYYPVAISNGRFAVVSQQNELLIYKDAQLLHRYALPVHWKQAQLFHSNGLLYVLDHHLNGVCYDVSGNEPRLMPAALQRVERLHNTEAPTTLYYNELNDQAVIASGRTIIVLGSDASGLFISKELVIDELPKSINNILFYPRHNTLFIGTTTDGLYVFRKNNFSQLLAPDLATNVNSNYAQLLLPGDRLRTNRGVTYDLNSGNAGFLQVDKSLEMAMYSPFSKDSSGGYYYCNEERVMYTAPNGTVKVIYENQLKKTKDNAISFVWLDSTTGKVWILESFRWGYLKNGVYTVAVDSPKEKLPKPYNFTRKENFIYLATERGLVILNEPKAKWRFAPGTNNMEVRFVSMDNQQPICWFGTYGHGFGAYLPERDSAYFFPQDPNHHLASTHALIEDSSRNFWVPTNKGLFRISKSQLLHLIDDPLRQSKVLHYDYFDRKDGLPTNEFNGGAQPIWNQWQGEYLLSSINGILRFNPAGISSADWIEPVFVDHVEVKDRPDLPAPAAGQPWQFGKDDRNVRWAINNAYWANPYSLRIEYRLDDQPNWKPIEGKELFTGWEILDAGAHVLHLRQFSADKATYRETNIPFSVKLYWYETFWVQALAAVLFLILFIWGSTYFYRQGKLRKAAKQKDEVISETYEMMEEDNALIEASNLYRSKMVYVLMHDVTVPVASMEKVSGMIYRNFDKVRPETMKEVMREINDAARNLLILSDQLVQWSNILDTDYTTVMEATYMHGLVEEIREELGDRFQLRNNQLLNLVPDDIEVVNKQNLLHLLLFNLILNANKNMNDGVIQVEASQTPEHTMLVIKDDASRMDDYIREQLITASASNDPSAVYSGLKLWHISYQIIFDLVKQMKGEIQIRSDEDGTSLVVAVTLPPADAFEGDQIKL